MAETLPMFVESVAKTKTAIIVGWRYTKKFKTNIYVLLPVGFVLFRKFVYHVCCVQQSLLYICHYGYRLREESNAITCVCLSVGLSISLLYLLNQLTFALDFVHMYGS